MMTRAVLVWLGLCIICFSTATQAATTRIGGATRYTSKKHDFALTIPRGWEKLPREVLDELKGRVGTRALEGESECLTGYIHGSPEQEGASVIIVVVCYRKNGRAISKRDIRKTKRDLSGADLKELTRESRKKGAHSHLREVQTRRVEYYEDRQVVLWDATYEDREGMWGESRCLFFFGNKACVVVCGISPEGRFQRCRESMEDILASFAFEPGAEFQETEWYESRVLAWGMLIVACVVLTFTLKRK